MIRRACLILVVVALVTTLAPVPRADAQSAGSGAADTQAADIQAVATFEPMDVFGLEWASDPQISPDGTRVVYVRNFMDVMSDRARSNLWILDVESGDHRPLTTGAMSHRSPRWSPSGDRLLWVSSADAGSQLWMRWMDTGQSARITNLTSSPSNVTWSPDGSRISLSMFVEAQPESLGAEMPAPPEGADWAPKPRVITKMQYRADGAGYLPDGVTHLFVVPADGGAPRQITDGDFNHGPHSWDPTGEAIVFSANRHANWRHEPANSEIYEVTLADGRITPLTDRQGPDSGPAVSPDGTRIAYTGNDERYQGYQLSRLYVMNRDGSSRRALTDTFDRDVQGPVWSDDGTGLWFQTVDAGRTQVAFVPVDGGEPEVRADRLGGTSTGRPYSSGDFSVAPDGTLAITLSDPLRPADVAVVRDGQTRQLTRLNEDLLGHKTLGEVEEIWWESSADGRRVQGWIVKPPGFREGEQYPMILEIHGGPFAAYGPHFAAEIQLYAAQGYVVFYTNPRGSSSYGEEFGNLIHHAYPGQDYDDLMSGVDALLARGYVDEDNLFVTGGSGGGVLTAWIVGHTDRFAAAVSQKPVINWYSFVLTADGPAFFSRYWFPGPPWEHLEHYMERSPLHHVGKVTTPTMLITGEQDYRTPISETEQFYTALQLRQVDTAMVRVPEASHGIASRPSHLIAKVSHVLAWFERYREPASTAGS